MSYDKTLADRIREALSELPDVEEKEMFSGICFMVKGKMCICISHDNLLCRIGAEAIEMAAELNGCKQAMMGGRTMKDYVYVSPEGFNNSKDFNHWVQLSLAFNPKAKASKKKS